MSALEDAIKAELGKPEARAAIEDIEGLILDVAAAALNSVLPGFLRALVAPLEQKGIDWLKALTDRELLLLAGGGLVLMKEYPTPNADQVHTKADLPAEVKADLGIKE